MGLERRAKDRAITVDEYMAEILPCISIERRCAWMQTSYMKGYHNVINHVRSEWLRLKKITYEENPLVHQARLVKDGEIKLPFDYVSSSVCGGRATVASHGEQIANGGKIGGRATVHIEKHGATYNCIDIVDKREEGACKRFRVNMI